jgi:hypothetical protein
VEVLLNTNKQELSGTNKVLKYGELSYDYEDNIFVIGDGVTPFKPLRARALARKWVGGDYTLLSLTFASSPYTIIPTTGITYYFVDCSGGAVVINCPTAIGTTATWGIKKTDSSLNTITIEPFGTETIDGNANQTILFQNTQLNIVSDNANLFIQ